MLNEYFGHPLHLFRDKYSTYKIFVLNGLQVRHHPCRLCGIKSESMYSYSNRAFKRSEIQYLRSSVTNVTASVSFHGQVGFQTCSPES